MAIQAQLADGTTLEFPDNTPDYVIDKTVKSQLSAQPEQPTAPQPPHDVSKLESAARGYLQGGSLSLGDEISGGGAAAVIKGGAELQQLLGNIPGVPQELLGVPQEFQDRSLGDIYREGRDRIRGKNKAAQEANPWTYGLSEVAGGALTIPAGKLAAPLNQATKLGRIGNAAIAGAEIGGITGFGGSEGDLTKGEYGKVAVDTGIGATIGGLTGATLQGGLERFRKNITPTADDIKALAQQQYAKAAESGAVLKPAFTDKFLGEVDKSMPQTEVGKALGKNSPLTGFKDIINEFRGRPISLQEAQEIDEHLGDLVDGQFTMGGLSKEGKRILDVQSSLRNMIDSAGEGEIAGGKEGFDALKQGRKLWSASARMRDIERIVTRAEMTDNPATSIKTGFRTLASNPSRMRGYSPAERKLIQRAAKTGLPGDLLRMAGSRLIPIIAGASGGGFGATATATAASTASRNMASGLQVGRANKVAEKIAQDATGYTAPVKDTLIDWVSKGQQLPITPRIGGSR